MGKQSFSICAYSVVLLNIVQQSSLGAGSYPFDQPTMLVLATSRSEVQREMRLSEHDIAKLTQLGKRWRTDKKGRQDFNGINQEVKAILGPKASQRLAQIAWQVRLDEALRSHSVAEQLSLTKRQQESIRLMWEASQKKLVASLRRIRFKSATDRDAHIWKHLDAVANEMRSVLNNTQQRKLKVVLGEPIDSVDHLRAMRAE